MENVTGVPSGQLYDANYDTDLIAMRTAAKQLCHEYNLLSPQQVEDKKQLLNKLLGSHRKDLIIEPPFVCDFGFNIHLGENFFSNHNLVILDGAPVTIGDNVFIGPCVGIHTAGHPLDKERRNEGLEYAKPVNIGNSVWIGAGVHILPGVSIGDGSVIGAGSVVTRDIPSGVVAAGNPCRVLREIDENDKKTQF